MTELSAHQEQKKLASGLDWILLLANEAVEAVEYALMEAGALGTEPAKDRTTPFEYLLILIKYQIANACAAELAEALRIYQLPSSSVREMSVAR